MVDSGLVGRLIEFQLLISEELRMAKLRQGSDKIDVDRLQKILDNVTKQLEMARQDPSDKRRENIRKGQEFNQSRKGDTEDTLERIKKIREDAAIAAEKAKQSVAEMEARKKAAAEAEQDRQRKAEEERDRQRRAEEERDRQRRAEEERDRQRRAEADLERQRKAEADLERQRRAEAERKAAWAELERRREASEAELKRQRRAADEREKQRRDAEADLERRRRAMEERERQRTREEEQERLTKAARDYERQRWAAEHLENQRKQFAAQEPPISAEEERMRRREEAAERAKRMEAERKRKEENWGHFTEKTYDWRARRQEEYNWRKNYAIFFAKLGITTPSLSVSPTDDELEVYMGFIQTNLSIIKKLYFQYLKQNREYHINNDTNNTDHDYATQANIVRIMNAVYDHLFREVFLSAHVEFMLRDVQDRLESLCEGRALQPEVSFQPLTPQMLPKRWITPWTSLPVNRMS
jgi:hypothetical protein